MDSLKTKIDAITAAVVAFLNALGAIIGLPHWASAEGAMLANSAALAIAVLIRYIVTKPAEPVEPAA